MAAEPSLQRKEGFQECEDFFRKNASEIIMEMVVLSNKTEDDTTPLVDEILHSIFFLGKIHDPPCPPESILGEEVMFEVLKECYPGPFELFSSQVPKRSPFSCVLDMYVALFGQENESTIKIALKQLIRRLRGDELLAKTICVSQIKRSDSRRYYGVSMSTSGRDPGRILAAASCLSAWDECVANAVLTYCPNSSKKTYFNGTFKLPNNVRCEAFDLKTQEPKEPCRSCGNMFGLTTNKTQKWAYGNCAEVESLSKFLRRETEVKEQVKQTQRFSDDNKERAKKQVKKDLQRLLKGVEFQWDNNYYSPEKIRPLE